jgi:hypothetical protein
MTNLRDLRGEHFGDALVNKVVTRMLSVVTRGMADNQSYANRIPW